MPTSAPKKGYLETHEHLVARVPIGTKRMLEEYTRVNGFRSKNQALNEIIHRAVIAIAY